MYIYNIHILYKTIIITTTNGKINDYKNKNDYANNNNISNYTMIIR